MNERIKRVREIENMTLTRFSEHIGISVSGLRKLESGENNPSERTIRAICSEFHVSRTWLETGEGEMYVERSREDELAALFADFFADDPAFKHRLIGALLRLEPEEWEVLEKLARQALEETKKAEPQ